GAGEGREYGTGDEADPAWAGGDRRQQGDRVRRMAAVVVEVVLHGLDGVEAERVGALGQPQALREVLCGRVVARPERREEVEAELHVPAPRRPAARAGAAGGERALAIRESRRPPQRPAG